MDGEIDPATLEPELADGDAPLVVDIRQPGAFRRGHIPDSVNLPLSELVATDGAPTGVAAEADDPDPPF